MWRSNANLKACEWRRTKAHLYIAPPFFCVIRAGRLCGTCWYWCRWSMNMTQKVCFLSRHLASADEFLRFLGGIAWACIALCFEAPLWREILHTCLRESSSDGLQPTSDFHSDRVPLPSGAGLCQGWQCTIAHSLGRGSRFGGSSRPGCFHKVCSLICTYFCPKLVKNGCHRYESISIEVPHLRIGCLQA